jgi:DNA-binding SARP family transcriptional activator/tetratricopeptide (TPR) repeat protein
MIHSRLFGNIELRNEQGLDLHSVLAHSKHVALLAYLVAGQGGLHRRDRLTALLWPDRDDARARNALSKALHHLRRSLGDDAIVTRGNEEIGLNAADWESDVISFEQAIDRRSYAEALDIYGKGELLDAFHLPDAPEFERWLDATRARLRERAVKAAMALAEDAERSADLVAASKWSQRAWTLSPYDEVALRRHLSMLDRTGDRAGALSVYQIYAEQLGKDLDAKPSPETHALIETIRSRVAASPSGAKSSPPVFPPAPGIVDDHPPKESKPALGRRTSLALAGVAAIAIAIAVAVTRSKASPTGGEHRVLVSELENRTGDVKLAPLGSMAADWITEGLQETGLTEIVDPVSTLMASRQLAPDTNRRTSLERADAIARQAGADIVVWGSVYREGDSLIYRVQISDIAKKRQIAAIEPVAASLTNSVEGANKLRAKVAGALASALDERIASVSAPSSRPPSFDAYKEYVLGLEAFAMRSGSEALPHFEAASRLDPDFVAPIVWGIFSYDNDGKIAQRDSLIRLLDAKRERLRPLDRYALQYFLAQQRNDRSGQFDAARAAARLSPGSEWSHNAAYIALEKNRPAEALIYLRQIDPEHGWARSWWPYWQNLTNALHLAGRYDEELVASQRIRQINSSEQISADVVAARALVGLGRAEEGERLFESMLLGTHEHSAYPGLYAYAGAQELSVHGHPELARKLWKPITAWFQAGVKQPMPKSIEDSIGFRVTSRQGMAQALYESGRNDEARPIFRALVEQDSTNIDAWIYLGILAAHRKNREEAESISRFLATRYAEEHEQYHPAAYGRAEIAAILGKREEAVSELQALVDKGVLHVLPVWLHRDPDWKSLRDYQPFQEMIREK